MRMPVSMMSDGINLEPNHVYVMPPVRHELESLAQRQRRAGSGVLPSFNRLIRFRSISD